MIPTFKFLKSYHMEETICFFYGCPDINMWTNRQKLLMSRFLVNRCNNFQRMKYIFKKSYVILQGSELLLEESKQRLDGPG